MTRAAAVRAIVLLLALFAAGCYEADVALDPAPLVPADARLIGSWRCVPPSTSEDAFTITVAAAAPRTYAITFAEPGKAPDRLDGYLSSVNGTPLLNVRTITTKRWNLVHYVLLTPDVATIQIVQDTLLKNLAPPAAPKTIEQQLANPLLYPAGAPVVCVRAK